jgi:hypothetical protein
MTEIDGDRMGIHWLHGYARIPCEIVSKANRCTVRIMRSSETPKHLRLFRQNLMTADTAPQAAETSKRGEMVKGAWP